MKRKYFRIIIVCIAFFLNFSFVKVDVKGVEVKNVYLTFDDGPSLTNTNNILSVLEKNNVNGTFFVVGKNIRQYPHILRKLHDRGMAIYPHCDDHTYERLYASKDSYFNDLNKCISLINQTLNKEILFNYLRMPGGSDNLVSNSQVLASIREDIIASGKNYLDWNIDSGDACSIRVGTEIIKDNIKKYGGSYKVEVVLMHDTENKDTTCEALQEIINDYKALGYNFKTINEIEDWEVNYLKNIRVINRR